MHKKPTDYFQYTDFLSQYNKFRITPRPPQTPTSTNPSSHPPQPSSPSIHSYSELYTTKQELHNCQLFLTEATNNFNLENALTKTSKTTSLYLTPNTNTTYKPCKLH